MADVHSMAANGVPVSVKDRERWTPEHHHEKPDPPVYLLSPVDGRTRRTIRTMTRRLAGDVVPTEDFRDCFREGAVAGLEPEQATAAIADLDELVALQGALEKQKDEEKDEAAVVRVKELEKAVPRWQRAISRRFQPLRDLQADNEVWWEVYCEVTVRACVQDWEGLAAPCVRRDGFVTPEAMMAIPEEDLDALKLRCVTLREVTPELEPDSVSP